MRSPNGQEQTRFQQGFLLSFAIILASTIILVIVNLIISLIVRNQLDQDILNKVIFSPDTFAPEQVERTQYLVSLISFPILCFVGWLVSNKLKARFDRLKPALYPAAALIVAIGTGLLLYFTLERTGFLYVQGFTFWALVFYLLVLLAVYLEWKYPSKWLSTLLKFSTVAIGLFVLLTVFFMWLNSEISAYNDNFEAYYYPLVQVFGGKTLLIDLYGHYGFYPYFLEPIFKITGLDVIQLTAVNGILLAGTFLIIFFLINRLIKNRSIAICAILAIPGTWLWYETSIRYDFSFQYWPHRILFPALLLLIVWFYQKAAGKARYFLYYLAFAISGIALLWNMDTGVIVFGSWVLFLYWETLGQWEVLHFRKTALALAKHTLIALVIVILSAGSLYFYTFARSGFFPDMSKLIEYQYIYYGAGFYMLPMPLVHPWNLVALTYMVGICISFKILVEKMAGNVTGEDPAQAHKFNMIFILSIMGAGIFSLYQGMSHDRRLPITFFTTFFLIAIYADTLLWHISKDTCKTLSLNNKVSNMATGSLFLLLSIILFCYAGGIAELFPKFVDRIQTQAQQVIQLKEGNDNKGVTSRYTQNIDLIRKYFSPGDEVLILGNQQTIYYMKSGTTNPVAVPGFTGLFLKADKQQVIDYLLSGTMVDKFKQPVPVRIIMSDDFKSTDYYQVVKENYIIVDRVNDLTVLEKRH